MSACTQQRQPVFAEPAVANRALEIVRAIHEQNDGTVCAATVMPDHVHLLFTLGERLRLGQVIGKLKSLTLAGDSTWAWQQDCFERRLRPSDSREEFGFYTFMNPYRAGLITRAERWPWWHCPDPNAFEFLALLRDDPVPEEWVGKSVSLRANLFRGK